MYPTIINWCSKQYCVYLPLVIFNTYSKYIYKSYFIRRWHNVAEILEKNSNCFNQKFIFHEKSKIVWYWVAFCTLYSLLYVNFKITNLFIYLYNININYIFQWYIFFFFWDKYFVATYYNINILKINCRKRFYFKI